MKHLHTLSAALVLSAALLGCDSDTAGSVPALPDGNVDSSPDYDRAFPQDRVARIDIVIPPADWQAMLDDMTDMLGEPGTGGPGGPGVPGGPGGFELPPELAQACANLAPGDECAASFMDMDIQGTCTTRDEQLVCLPSGLPGGGGGNGAIELLPRTPIYVEAEVQVDGTVWSHVGVRFKGNSSLAMPWRQGVSKLPLRLKFDEFDNIYPETKRQRFYGFQSLSLSNSAMDASLLRDKLGTDIFAEAGLAVPATAFYRVFIDHGNGPVYFGLYTAVELPQDDAFLDTHFGNHNGNLYKPDGDGARWQTFDTTTLGKETNEDEADFSDAQALYDALHADRGDAAAWRTQLEQHLDVDGFLSWLAINTVIQDWDTYGRMAHNYYLYADPAASGRFTWIPWDHSFAFSGSQQPLSLGLREVSDAWPLIRYLMDDPVYAARYREHVAAAVQTVYEPAHAEQRFRAAHALIEPYVVGPEGEIDGYTFLSSDSAFTDALEELTAHASARQAAVNQFLAAP